MMGLVGPGLFDVNIPGELFAHRDRGNCRPESVLPTGEPVFCFVFLITAETS